MGEGEGKNLGGSTFGRSQEVQHIHTHVHT